MNKLGIVLAALFGFGTETGTYMRAQAERESNRIYRVYIVRSIFAAIVLLMIGWGLNWAGAKEANIIISLIFVTAVAIWGYQPDHLFRAGVFGIAFESLLKDIGVTKGIEDYLKYFNKVMLRVLLYGALSFFVLGVLPVRESPFSFFIAMASMAILMLMSLAWDMKMSFKRPLLYSFVVAMLALSIFSLTPRETIYKFTGKDLKASFASSKTEQALMDVKKEKEKVDDESREAKLKEIQTKIKMHLPLTPEDEKLIKDEDEKLQNGFFSKKPTPPAVIQPQQAAAKEMPTRKFAAGVGEYKEYDLGEFKAGEETPYWITTTPCGRLSDIRFRASNHNFKLVFEDGTDWEVLKKKGVDFSTTQKFKIVAIDATGITLRVKTEG